MVRTDKAQGTQGTAHSTARTPGGEERDVALGALAQLLSCCCSLPGLGAGVGGGGSVQGVGGGRVLTFPPGTREGEVGFGGWDGMPSSAPGMNEVGPESLECFPRESLLLAQRCLPRSACGVGSLARPRKPLPSIVNMVHAPDDGFPHIAGLKKRLAHRPGCTSSHLQGSPSAGFSP